MAIETAFPESIDSENAHSFPPAVPWEHPGRLACRSQWKSFAAPRSPLSIEMSQLL
jgi:hypothetical protein